MTVDDAVRAVLEAANKYTERNRDRGLPHALSAIADIPENDRDAVVQGVTQCLYEVEAPAGAGLIALWLGAAVERGADAKVSGKSVVESLIQWSEKLPGVSADAGSQDDFELPDDDADLISGLDMLGRAAVAHFSRDKELLTSLRNNAHASGILSAANDRASGPMWVMEAMNQRSGDIVVLHGVARRGFRIRYENLSNCFHFFTLLQGALGEQMPGGRKPSKKTLAAALEDEKREVRDQAWWHYGQGSSPSPELRTMIFGEATLDSIESIDGIQVILLWPPVLDSRGWDGGFFSPLLATAPPSVSVEEELEECEIERWRLRLSLPDADRKPWWKRF